MNHHGLFIKLMQRSLPSKLLSVFENWFDKCFTCVRWGSVYSISFKLSCGIRQGGVLSPYFFAVYIDDIVAKVKSLGIGCHLGLVCFSIILYADDILLLAPSVTSLQKLVNVCEDELRLLDLAINSKKSVCIRIGPRCGAECGVILTLDGSQILWVEKLRYLGIFIVSSKSFRCCFENAKKSFYRAFNAIFGKIGRAASEEVILSLIKSKCLPCLLFCVEACPLNKSDIRSLNFTVTRVLMKLFRTYSNSVIEDCQRFFNFASVDILVTQRTISFLKKVSTVGLNNLMTNVFIGDSQRRLALVQAPV